MTSIVLCDSAATCHEHYRSVGQPAMGIHKGSVCWQCGHLAPNDNMRHLHVLNSNGHWEGVCSEGCAIKATQKGII